MSCTWNDKQRLRRWALRCRGRQSPDSATAAGELLAGYLAQHRAFLAARTVAGYLSMPGELGMAAVLRLCHTAGRQVLVPTWSRVTQRYGFCRWRPEMPLVSGPLRVREPRERDWVACGQIDLVLVPGLLFDESGGRLGFGAGHYDGLLARCRPGAFFMGIGYEWQLIWQVPQMPHDVPLHAIATPGGIHDVPPLCLNTAVGV